MKTTYYQNNKTLKTLMCEKFVHKLPIYLEVAVETEQSYEVKELANAMDYFEFHFRHYISGISKTLHRVLKEARYLISRKEFDETITATIMQIIENDILESELYELMPRHLHAKSRVKNLLIRKNQI